MMCVMMRSTLVPLSVLDIMGFEWGFTVLYGVLCIRLIYRFFPRLLQVGEYQMRFDRIQSGCPPPRITKVATDASSPDSMVSSRVLLFFNSPIESFVFLQTVRADVECSECVLQVALIQQTATSVKVSNCDVSLTKLSGQVSSIKSLLLPISSYNAT